MTTLLNLPEQQIYNKTDEEFNEWLESVEWVQNFDETYNLFPWQESCTDYLWNTVNEDKMDFLEDRQKRLIERLAYSIWEQEGCPHGKDLEHWVLAEKEVWKIV